MCEHCDNFQKNDKLSSVINDALLLANIDVQDGMGVLAYICGVAGAFPDDNGKREPGMPYAPSIPEEKLTAFVVANVAAAYRYVKRLEIQRRQQRPGRVN